MFTQVTVTRDYDLATGAAPTGTVSFTPSAWLVNGVVVPAAPVATKLDALGQISIDLFANTDPATTPAASHYTVQEDIDGQPRRTYQVVVPHNVGSTVNLSALVGLPGSSTFGLTTTDTLTVADAVSRTWVARSAGDSVGVADAVTRAGAGTTGYGTSGYGTSGYGL